MLSTWDTNEGCERLTDAKTKGAAYLPDLWSTMIDPDMWPRDGLLEPSPSPTAAKATTMRRFTLMVSSDDETLLPYPHRCVASAGTVGQLEAAVQEQLILSGTKF